MNQMNSLRFNYGNNNIYSSTVEPSQSQSQPLYNTDHNNQIHNNTNNYINNMISANKNMNYLQPLFFIMQCLVLVLFGLCYFCITLDLRICIYNLFK